MNIRLSFYGQEWSCNSTGGESAPNDWVAFLRIGMGLQLLFFSFSMRNDWLPLFENNASKTVSRDLSEALLSAQSHFIPRLGWLVQGSAALGLSEVAISDIAFVLLLGSGFLLAIGLFCRSAAVGGWFLHLCAVKSAHLMTYGVDNVTTIGLFYLMFAPLPDRLALDCLLKGPVQRNHYLAAACRRVLQVHVCIIYFFSGLTKALGVGWWNGTSLWRSLTSPPYDVISSHVWARLALVLPLLGISVWVLEIGYPIFIWVRKTRLIWFLAIIAMHLAIALAMGLYLFAFVMIVLNLASFGTEALPFLKKITLHERPEFLVWTAFPSPICSRERKSIVPSTLAMYITQANWETSANGAGFMDPTLKPLKTAFEAIRDTAIKALSQIEQSQEERSMRWKCKECEYIKHFTKPVLLETTGRCPRCKSTEFRPIR
jgi:hypothetical protein